MKQGRLHLLTCILGLTTQAVVGQLFNSVHDLEALAQQEHRLLNTLQDYISTQQAKLSLLHRKLEQIAKVWPPEQTVDGLISDPISAYSLVRRLTREWPLILNYMMNNVDIQDEFYLLPKEDFMDSAIRTLTRLQHVYKLDTRQLAPESRGSASLTALDCFELGKYLFKEHKYDAAVTWFKESLERIATKDDTVEQDKILPHLYLATIHSGCVNGIKTRNATNVLQYLMTQYPNFTLDKESAPLFTEALTSDCPGPEKLNKTEEADFDVETFESLYSETCRGIGAYYSSELRCYYIHYNNPRLLIAPFKMEEQNLDPPVLMFHDVISDQEIDEMKVAFSEERSSCHVISEKEDENTEYYRTCDVGWVKDDVTTSARLTRRVGHMTNLVVKISEYNQVASYGLGGEFKLHYDPLPKDGALEKIIGNRIATVMFYLNDVDRGGYTVFPRLNLAVKPIKGSALFWFNIDHRSDNLKILLHGGCPILKGSKWVLNKWIREYGETSDMFCPTDEIFPRPRFYTIG